MGTLSQELCHLNSLTIQFGTQFLGPHAQKKIAREKFFYLMANENKLRISNRRYKAIYSGKYTELDRKEELQLRPKFQRKPATRYVNIKW